jgi:hypothetical protein
MPLPACPTSYNTVSVFQSLLTLAIRFIPVFTDMFSYRQQVISTAFLQLACTLPCPGSLVFFRLCLPSGVLDQNIATHRALIDLTLLYVNRRMTFRGGSTRLQFTAPGAYLITCRVAHHYKAGLRALYDVLPATTQYTVSATREFYLAAGVLLVDRESAWILVDRELAL